MLPVKKLYIDSKARTKDSKSTTNFSIDLVESLNMPEGAAFQVCDVLIPHTWYLIDENNCHLYFFEMNGPNGSGSFFITLATGSYDGPTLAGEISKGIQHNSNSFKQFRYDVTYDGATEKIHITASGKAGNVGTYQWKILTDEEVKLSTAFPINDPQSLNKFLGNTTSKTFIPDDPSNSSGFFSKRLQFNPIKYIFIKSANLGTFNTLGSFGERTVIKKVPVMVPQGEMILDDTRSGNDMLSCEKQTLKRLEFTITDEVGNVLDLNGHDVSFSLIFSIIP